MLKGFASDVKGMFAKITRRDMTVRAQSNIAQPERAGGDMIAYHDESGRFARVAGDAEALTGLSAQRLKGLAVTDIAAPEDAGAVRAALAAVCSEGRSAEATFRTRREDGAVWVEMRLSRGRAGQILSISRDVTRRRAAEDAARRACAAAEAAAKARARMLADMSHEIRTPLNAVIGFADVMKSETFGPLGNDKYAEYIELIHRSGRHVLDLLSDVLDVSKIEAEKYVLKRERVDLEALARQTAEIVRLSAEEAGLSLIVDAWPDLPAADADPRAVRQILLNLLSNAIKFTKVGEVRLTIWMDGGDLVATVEDTGVGMSEAQLARAGLRFEQAHTEGVRGAKGTGLGLALTRGLVELHGGLFALDSAPGEGTVVEVRLPAARAEISELPTARRDLPDADASGDRDSPVHGQLKLIEGFERELSARRGAA